MRVSTAEALYGLSLEAFIDGVADEVTRPEALGLSEVQAMQIRKKYYAQRIRERREKGRAA
jgi:hypothetical protein